MRFKHKDRSFRRDFVSDSDHEQYERDYYDRHAEDELPGCIVSIILLLASIVFLLFN